MSYRISELSRTADGLDLASLEVMLPKHERVVLVCDVVESVRWIEHDEDQAVARWRAFAAAVRSAVAPAHNGEVVKSTGDGLMMAFSTAIQALHAAYEMHSVVGQGNLGLASQDQMHLRIGIHQTEAQRDAHDLYGHGINLAARITTLAGPGEIVMTSEVREQLTDGVDGQIEDMGDCYLKHIRHPQRLYRISADQAHPVYNLPAYNEALTPTIAVLPFRSLLALASQIAVGDLIADCVISCLARSEELRVLSRLSTAGFAGKSLALQDIAEPLGATHVVTGSFMVEEANILVTCEMARASDSRVLWSERCRVEMADLFRVDSELAAKLANGVHTTLLQSEAKRALTEPLPSLAGYSLLLGSIAMMHRQSTSSFQKSRVLLAHLQDRYPRKAMPLAWQGKWYALGSAQGWIDSQELRPAQVLQDMDRAIELESDLSLSWTIKGLIQGYVLRDFDAARQSYDHATCLNANDALTWLYRATLAAWSGDGLNAKCCAEKALALSPLDPSRYYYESLAGTALIASGHYADAAALARSSLRANAAHASTYKTLLLALALEDKTDEALPVAEQVLRRDPGFCVQRFLDMSPMAQSPQGPLYASAYRSVGIPHATLRTV